MARSKSPLDSDRFTFRLYKDTLPKDKLFYERDCSIVLADRSTGEADVRRAAAARAGSSQSFPWPSSPAPRRPSPPMASSETRGLSANVIVDALNAIRAPLSWAGKRGILSRAEVAKIAALPTVEEVAQRSRPKNKEKNTGPAPIGLCTKVIVLLAELAAMRRGEIRAL